MSQKKNNIEQESSESQEKGKLPSGVQPPSRPYSVGSHSYLKKRTILSPRHYFAFRPRVCRMGIDRSELLQQLCFGLLESVSWYFIVHE